MDDRSRNFGCAIVLFALGGVLIAGRLGWIGGTEWIFPILFLLYGALHVVYAMFPDEPPAPYPYRTREEVMSTSRASAKQEEELVPHPSEAVLVLNRSLVMVRHAKPFLDWVASLKLPKQYKPKPFERTCYLVDRIGDSVDRRMSLANAFDSMFTQELFRVIEDEQHWPKNRTLELFQQWFQIEVHEDLIDVCGYECELQEVWH